MTKDDCSAAYKAGDQFDGWPITPLGHTGGKKLWFLTQGGDVVDLTPRDLTWLNILALHGAREDWLLENFPNMKKDSNSGRMIKVGWNLGAAQKAHLKAALDMGPFDQHSVRGPGVWPDGQGGLILHCGDQVNFQNEWVKAGLCHGGFVYPLTQREWEVSDEEARIEDSLEILDLLQTWNWQGPSFNGTKLSAMLFLGWNGNAMLTGALPWRPHILVTGGHGVGKSELNKLAGNFQGPRGLVHASNPSAAGVRQILNSAARSVMLDEVESADGDNRRSEELIALVRMGSTDGQGAVLRGTPEGKAQSFMIRACFYLSAINPPRLLPQDASRIAVLDLAPLAPGSDPVRVRNGITAVTAKSPHLRARMIARWDQLKTNFDIFRQAFGLVGASSRQCDQYGWLFAAHDVLTQETSSCPERALALANLLLRDQIMGDPSENDPDQCLTHLLTTTLDLPWRSGRHSYTIAEIIQIYIENPTDNKEYNQSLASHGLKIMRSTLPDQPWALVVANSHRGLDAIYRNTRWQKGGWKRALRRLKAAFNNNDTVNLAKVTHRCTWIREEALSRPDELGSDYYVEKTGDINDDIPEI